MAQIITFGLIVSTTEEQPVEVGIAVEYLAPAISWSEDYADRYPHLSEAARTWLRLLNELHNEKWQAAQSQELAQEEADRDKPLREGERRAEAMEHRSQAAAIRERLVAFEREQPEASQEVGDSILQSWGIAEGDRVCAGAYEWSANQKYVRRDRRGLPYVATGHPQNDNPKVIRHYTYEAMAHQGASHMVPGFQNWRRKSAPEG